MYKTILLFGVLLATNMLAQAAQTTATPLQTYASVVFTTPDGTLGVLFVERNSPPFCDLSCTTLGYSLCVNPVPGCQEGSGFAPSAAFVGNLSGNYRAHDILTLQYEAVTNTAPTSSYFVNIICNAFDQEGNCTSETVIPGDAGLIQLSFTKTSTSALLNSNTQETIGNGTIQTATSVNDLFSAVASGSLIGFGLSPANSLKGTSVAFAADYTSTRPQGGPPSASEILKPQLPDAVRRRIEVLQQRINNR
jgi:hypothetical protein